MVLVQSAAPSLWRGLPTLLLLMADDEIVVVPSQRVLLAWQSPRGDQIQWWVPPTRIRGFAQAGYLPMGDLEAVPCFVNADRLRRPSAVEAVL